MSSLTNEPRSQNELAEERNLLAGERTLQAWVRSSLSMITFGFMIAQYFHLVGETLFHPIHFPAKWFGFAIVCLGTILPLIAVVQHITRIKRLTTDELNRRPVRNLAVITGLLISVLGLCAITILVVMVLM